MFKKNPGFLSLLECYLKVTKKIFYKFDFYPKYNCFWVLIFNILKKLNCLFFLRHAIISDWFSCRGSHAVMITARPLRVTTGSDKVLRENIFMIVSCLLSIEWSFPFLPGTFPSLSAQKPRLIPIMHCTQSHTHADVCLAFPFKSC